MDKSDLSEGSYDAELKLNHEQKSYAGVGFKNYKKGKIYTSTREEENYLNRGIMYRAQNPEKSYKTFDTLFTKYPLYLDRGSAFSYAVPTYMQVADSLTVLALVDSIETYLPNMYSYNKISMSSFFLNKYLDLGLKYSLKAIQTIEDVPKPYQNSYLFSYQKILSQLYLAKGNDEAAFKTFLEALTAFNNLPPYNRYYMYDADVDIFNSLGSLCEKKKDYDGALVYYKKGLTKDLNNKDLWVSLQRVYSFKNNSDSSYNDFKKEFIATLPKDKQTTDTKEKYVGQTFPDFSLSTLDDKKFQLVDIKGKVTVINYWAYWCGTCLEERPLLEKLFNEFKGKDFAMIGIHSQIGHFGNKNDEVEIIQKVVKKYPATFPNVIQTADSKTNAAIGVDGVPTIIILDKKGNIRFEEIGFDKYIFFDRMKENIKKLLAE
jgi:thiol-disulfide isomerase/thioredoxin